MDQKYTRTFLCIPVSDQTRKALADIQLHIKQVAPGLSIPHLSDAHLTLVFLGEVSSEKAQRVSHQMDEVCSRFASFHIQVGGGGCFGPTRNPKIVWAGVNSPPVLLDLQQALARMAGEAGFTLENRPFKPHLTIARIRTRLPRPALTSIITCINNTNFAEIPVDRVLFMNSLLNGSGPRYTTIHRSLLKG